MKNLDVRSTKVAAAVAPSRCDDQVTFPMPGHPAAFGLDGPVINAGQPARSGRPAREGIDAACGGCVSRGNNIPWRARSPLGRA